MTVGWCSRTIRAGMFAALCVLVAALGHVLMSGSDVPAWALAAGVGLTGAAGWCLAGRERGLPLVVAVVVLAQAVLHSAFSLAQTLARETPKPKPSGGGTAVVRTGGCGAPEHHRMDSAVHHTDSAGHMGTPEHHAGGPRVGAGHLGADPLHPLGRHPGHMPRGDHMGAMGHMDHSMGGMWSFGMLSAHLLAALLCGLWLAYGEQAAFRILRTVAGWLAAPWRLPLTRPLTPDGPRPRPAYRRAERAPALLLLVHAITSRGPPVEPAVV
ncbi:hypothetical protein FM076_31065 [Streptomyces albus subsp. chlorinus]|uniref:hypothetical protein n=1 Tax=Streptomyces albus TaxID=1888 RepID=UPI00156F0913|nr:hypothetical protein [Streptomyces albus]NSC25353.1 hypothetical protein [Streptomyces albus subsp. chlorinus]